MTAVPIGRATVDHCDHCGALWLDAGELPLLLSNKDWADAVDTGGERAPRPTIAPQGRLCPRDGVKLVESHDHNQKHVRIDKCPTCLGVLLDAGELTDLSKFTIAERLRALI